MQASDVGLRSAVRAQAGDPRVPIAPGALLAFCPSTMTGRAWRSLLAALDQGTEPGLSARAPVTGPRRDGMDRIADLLARLAADGPAGQPAEMTRARW